MEIVIHHVGGVQFEVKARGHTVYCDQPIEAGGFDEGMTPPEFLLASLGTCAGYYAVQYLNSRGLTTEGLQVRIAAEKVKNPARLDQFAIDIDYPTALDEKDRAGVLGSVNKCLIHNTLTHPPKIGIRLNESQLAG